MAKMKHPHMKRKTRMTTTHTHDGREVEITPAQWLLAEHLKELGVGFWFEYPFYKGRDWTFDLADTDNSVAFECNGGKWSGGHRRGDAIDDENEKLNTAALAGWRVLQFTNDVILDGRAKAFLANLFGKES